MGLGHSPLYKPERIRYYIVREDCIEIHNPNGGSVSIENSTDITAVRKAYAPLVLRKMPLWVARLLNVEMEEAA